MSTGVVAVICCFVTGANKLGILPSPRPALDMDRTILVHKADSSKRTHDAEIVLIGDSSCLMDVSAVELSEHLGKSVINLGTLSFLDAKDFSLILKHYFENQNSVPEAVVLLVHPEWLRRFGAESYHSGVIRAFYAREDFCFSDDFQSRLSCAAGIEALRSRVISRLLPMPLSGAARTYYGFNADLWRFLDDHAGSAVDPGVFDADAPHGNADYRISENLRRDAPLLRSVLPAGVRLIIGLTPTPSIIADDRFHERWNSLMSELGGILSADYMLVDLPPSLASIRFASKTHLAEAARGEYTKRLADELRTGGAVR